jgi:hypothetical protein
MALYDDISIGAPSSSITNHASTSHCGDSSSRLGLRCDQRPSYQRQVAWPAGIGSRCCYTLRIVIVTFFDRDICTESLLNSNYVLNWQSGRWRSPDTTSLVNIQKNSNSKHMLESSGQCGLIPDLHSQEIRSRATT